VWKLGEGQKTAKSFLRNATAFEPSTTLYFAGSSWTSAIQSESSRPMSKAAAKAKANADDDVSSVNSSDVSSVHTSDLSGGSGNEDEAGK
jgi:hypothetical protein